MKSISQALSDWRRSRQAMDNLVNNLPRIIGNECVAAVKQNFNLQGYDSGNGVKRWANRKDQTNKNYTYGRKKGGKSKYKGSVFNADAKILLQTMNLYNGVTYKVAGKSIFVGVDKGIIPYAAIHNEGLPGKAFGKYSFQMPKRQFMPLPNEGPNIKMLKRISSKINFEKEKALAPLKN